MNYSAFFIFLFALQAICFFVGKRSSKGIDSQEDYFLAGKSLRFFPLMMTFLATQVGGGLILGSAEEAFRYGWSVIFYPLGASLGLIILGLGAGNKLAEMKISTVAQIFEAVYGSPLLKKIASVLSIVSLFMIFVAQIIASQKFMLSLGIDNSILFFAFWGIVIFYTAAGGLKAVVATDIVQALFFIASFVFCLGFVCFSSKGDVPLSAIFQTEEFAFNPSKLSGWLLMPLLFMLIEQDMGQRCFAAKSPKTVAKAALWAGIGALAISLIPLFFGILAKKMNLSIPDGSSVLMEAVRQTTSPTITALVGCAIIAAIISTADSLINAISSNLTQDFKWEINIRASQVLTAVIAILGIAFSFSLTNVVDVLIQSYELSVSCLFVPIFFAMIKQHNGKAAAFCAVIMGGLSFVLFKFLPLPFPREFASLAFSLAGFYFGNSFFSSKAIILPEQSERMRSQQSLSQH